MAVPGCRRRGTEEEITHRRAAWCWPRARTQAAQGSIPDTRAPGAWGRALPTASPRAAPAPAAHQTRSPQLGAGHPAGPADQLFPYDSSGRGEKHYVRSVLCVESRLEGAAIQAKREQRYCSGFTDAGQILPSQTPTNPAKICPIKRFPGFS